MATHVGEVVQHLRQMVQGERTGLLRDAELLQAFASTHADEAFAVMVERHGPMILGVCRRILRNTHDAEDAFQATFLVLARRAAAIRNPASLAAWLHGIALRLALNMKRTASKRHLLEQQAASPLPVPPGDLGLRELHTALDEELQRLPENNRQPLLLCYLQGLTQDDAARQLGWPRGTLKRRLERGRMLLKARLTKRGMTLAAALVGAGAAGETLALSPSAPLASTTIKAASLVAAGRVVAEKIISSKVVALAEGAAKAMFLARLLSLAAAALLVVVCCGVGLAAYAHLSAGPLADGLPTVKSLKERDEQKTRAEPDQAAPGKKAAAATVGHFEAMAAQLEIFQTEEFTRGRGDLANGTGRFLPARMTRSWQKVYGQLIASKDDPEDLIGLLKHVNPRVRTLALAALFERQDPQFLPIFAAQVGDKELTVPEIVIRRAFAEIPEKKGEDLQPLPEEIHGQSVGRVARTFLDFWLQRAGYAAKDFDSYWAARKDRKFCASWFLARLVRAGQARSPFDARRAPIVRAIRKEIDALPAVDRDWTLLWLAANQAANAEPGQILATPQDLLAAGKRLGPERLMDMIADRPISSDPDLAAKDRTRGRDKLAFWVLRHAGNLLRPEDAPTLLDLESLPRGHPPESVVAAAELQPANASKWLHAAMERFQAKGKSSAHARAILAAGLWRSVGDSEINYLADWFYHEKVNKNPHSTQTGAFLEAVRGVRAPADRKLLARLVLDPRLDKLDYQSLQALVETVNRLTKQPVVGASELRPIWQNGSWGPETPGDFNLVAQWRVKLRKSVAEWR